MNYKYFESLPEANPIIRPEVFQSQNLRLASLYHLNEKCASLESIQEITWELSREMPNTSLKANAQTFEEMFSENLVYDKYAEMQPTQFSRALREGSRFNQMLCNVQKIYQIRKNASTNVEVKQRNPKRIGVSFDSEFESGNLSKVSQISENEYNLLLQFDINSKGHTQWFYFRVLNRDFVGPLKLNLVNLTKGGYLYECGMKIAINSFKQQNGWTRGGININYRQNGIVKQQLDENNFEYWYTLSFVYEFTEQDDEVYFAHSVPYTVTQLNKYLLEIEQSNGNRYITRQQLCKSILGNRIEKITITDPENPDSNKKSIVIMGRVHPGETVASYMVEGIITWLLSNDPAAEAIRKHFVVRVIPLLNPDGVIHGNYRCSLAGCDLNRRWSMPSKELHPEIHYAKNMISNLNKQTRISLFIDCHGHNLKRSVFMYGCNIKSDDVQSSLQNLACKQFAYLLSKIDKNFSYKNSSFVVQKCRTSTARITLWSDLKIPQVYTLEASFCGPENSNVHFTTQDLKEVGANVGIGIFQYFFNPKTSQPISRRFRLSGQKDDENRVQQLILGLRYLEDDIEQFSGDEINHEVHQQLLQLACDNKDDSHGSASDPSMDNLSQERVLPSKVKKSKTNYRKPASSDRQNLSIVVSEMNQPPKTERVLRQPARKLMVHSLRLPAKQEAPKIKEKDQSLRVKVPLKIFDTSWLMPQSFQAQQELKQRHLLKQMMEAHYRREIEKIVANMNNKRHRSDSTDRVKRAMDSSFVVTSSKLRTQEQAQSNSFRDSNTPFPKII